MKKVPKKVPKNGICYLRQELFFYHVKEVKLIAPEREVAAWLALKAMGSKLDNSHCTLFSSVKEFEQA